MDDSADCKLLSIIYKAIILPQNGAVMHTAWSNTVLYRYLLPPIKLARVTGCPHSAYWRSQTARCVPRLPLCPAIEQAAACYCVAACEHVLQLPRLLPSKLRTILISAHISVHIAFAQHHDIYPVWTMAARRRGTRQYDWHCAIFWTLRLETQNAISRWVVQPDPMFS
jgi:hypothetical protein